MKRLSLSSYLCLIAVCLNTAVVDEVCAQSGESLAVLSDHMPPNTPVRIFIENTSAETLSINGPDDIVDYEWKRDENALFKDFVRVKVKKVGENPWTVTAKSVGNTETIKKGEWVYAGYYVRATPGTSQASTRGFIERATPSWMMVSDASVATSEQWTRVVAVGRAEQDFDIGQVHLSLHLAHTEQSVDIADLVFLSVDKSVKQEAFPATQLSYVGMKDDAPWRKQAQKMIANYRSNNFTIHVLNRAGEALKNTELTVKMKDIDFDLGSMAHGLIVEDSEQGEQYRQWFKRFFNYATATIYWADWGWENPDVRDEYLTKMGYFKQEGIPMRGHVLLYPAFRFSPQVLNSLENDREAFIARVNQHIDEMVPILRAYGMTEYDVINELRAEKEWLDIVGLDTVVDWYKRVHALHPQAILYVNENSILTEGGDNTAQKDHYFNLIKTLLEKGAPIHGIGMQGHFSGIVTPPEKMWSILDRFASFDLPIRITEYDTDTRDTKGQAKFDTDFYEAMYAHPAVEGVTRWGFYEPVMWRPAGALINAKDKLKPNAQQYLDWLKEKRSFSATFKTDENGVANFSAKYGKYRVFVAGEELKCHFTQVSFDVNYIQDSQVPACTLRLSK